MNDQTRISDKSFVSVGVLTTLAGFIVAGILRVESINSRSLANEKDIMRLEGERSEYHKNIKDISERLAKIEGKFEEVKIEKKN